MLLKDDQVVMNSNSEVDSLIVLKNARSNFKVRKLEIQCVILIIKLVVNECTKLKLNL